jgi:hypothetical protein
MRSLIPLVLVIASAATAGLAKDELPTGELVKQHLNSIGTQQARTGVKNRLAQGSLTFQWLDVAGVTEGQLQFVSEGDKFVSVLKLPSPQYHGEQFVSNGSKTVVKQTTPGVYSGLGRFVFEHPEVLTEGLWGGTLSTAWPLEHLEDRRARLEDQGLKKVDGRDLRRVDYVPRKSSDLQIELYFEPDTYRHVMTVYSYHVEARGGGGAYASANKQETYYRLEERFADFKSVDDIMLPTRWTVQFSSDSTQIKIGGATSGISQFQIQDPKISHNISVDPRNFDVK